MPRPFLVLAVVLCCARNAPAASTGLEPIRASLSGRTDLRYYAELGRALFGGEAEYRYAQMVAMPSSRPAEAVFIEALPPGVRPTGHRVVHVLAGASVARASDDQPVPTLINRAAIDSEVANAVQRVWLCAACTASYGEPRTDGRRVIVAVLNGTEYQFSTFVSGVGWPSARTYEPKPHTVAAGMVALGRTLMEYADSGPGRRDAVRGTILRRVDKLRRMFRESGLDRVSWCKTAVPTAEIW